MSFYVVIRWPNACVGCGIDDYMGVTRYDIRIGDPERDSGINFHHLGLKGSGTVYLCNPCKEKAIFEQKKLFRERIISLVASIFAVFFIPALLFPPSIDTFMSYLIVTLVFYSSPAIVFVIRFSRVRNLEPFHSYLNISVDSQGIRVDLKNPQFTTFMNDINNSGSLRIEYKPEMRVASVKSGAMWGLAFTPAAFIVPVFLIMYLMGTTILEILYLFGFPILAIFLISFLPEYIYFRLVTNRTF